MTVTPKLKHLARWFQNMGLVFDMQCATMQQGVGIISQVKLGRIVATATDWMGGGGARWMIEMTEEMPVAGRVAGFKICAGFQCPYRTVIIPRRVLVRTG